MTITRGLAAGAMLAGLALGLTAPAAAAEPLNGHYTETETYPDGHQVHDDWSITPCGDGCATIGDIGQANLVGGKWTLNGSGGVTCEQGGDTPNAIGFHYSWDPETLVGTVKITNNEAVCGNPKGYHEVHKLQLVQAS